MSVIDLFGQLGSLADIGRVEGVVLLPALLLAVVLLPWPVPWTTHIETRIRIARPPDQVFDAVTTAGLWPRWHPSSLAVWGVTDRPARVGDWVTEQFCVAGRRGKVRWQVAECHAPQRWVIEGTASGRGVLGAVRGTITYTLKEEGSKPGTGAGGGADGADRAECEERALTATHFHRALVYPVPNLLFGLLNALFIRRRVEAESAQALAQLKVWLEERPPLAGTP